MSFPTVDWQKPSIGLFLSIKITVSKVSIDDKIGKLPFVGHN